MTDAGAAMLVLEPAPVKLPTFSFPPRSLRLLAVDVPDLRGPEGWRDPGSDPWSVNAQGTLPAPAASTFCSHCSVLCSW